MALGITPLETLMTVFCEENNAETGRPSLYNRLEMRSDFPTHVFSYLFAL